MKNELLLYGAQLDALRLRRVIDHVFKQNVAAEERGQRGTPISPSRSRRPQRWGSAAPKCG